VIDWLGGLLPEFDLPLDSSDEELREYLIDGAALCYLAEKLMPGVQEVSSPSSEMPNFSCMLLFLI
jgi:kinesin family protein C2/C3